MRSRSGELRPCTYCGQLSRFQVELRGPRGAHLRWVDVCVECGENPARDKKAAA